MIVLPSVPRIGFRSAVIVTPYMYTSELFLSVHNQLSMRNKVKKVLVVKALSVALIYGLPVRAAAHVLDLLPEQLDLMAPGERGRRHVDPRRRSSLRRVASLR